MYDSALARFKSMEKGFTEEQMAEMGWRSIDELYDKLFLSDMADELVDRGLSLRPNNDLIEVCESNIDVYNQDLDDFYEEHHDYIEKAKSEIRGHYEINDDLDRARRAITRVAEFLFNHDNLTAEMDDISIGVLYKEAKKEGRTHLSPSEVEHIDEAADITNFDMAWDNFINCNFDTEGDAIGFCDLNFDELERLAQTYLSEQGEDDAIGTDLDDDADALTVVGYKKLKDRFDGILFANDDFTYDTYPIDMRVGDAIDNQNEQEINRTNNETPDKESKKGDDAHGL